MRALLLAALLAAAFPARAADVEPMLDLRALGGQYFFRGVPASASGNLSASAAAAVRRGSVWTLIPAASSSYEGTKGALELAGGGTLYQERQVHRLSLRGVAELSGGWRLKPYAGGRYELVNETRDEKWGKGLFDHRQLELGLEGEWEWREPHSLRLGAGAFDTRFPNYEALAARAEAAAFGLGRPHQSARVLDSRSLHASAALDAPVGETLVVEGSVLERYTRHPGQSVVGASGELTGKPREDVSSTLAASARAPLSFGGGARAVVELSGACVLRVSNQNGYDAARGEFFPLAENSRELKGGLSARALFGPARRPKQAGLSLELSSRKWPRRPAQDERGVPSGAPLRQSIVRLAASGSWPLTDRFSLLASADWLRSSSNQGYQAFYAYRYTAANYLLGFSFEY